MPSPSSTTDGLAKDCLVDTPFLLVRSTESWRCRKHRFSLRMQYTIITNTWGSFTRRIPRSEKEIVGDEFGARQNFRRSNHVVSFERVRFLSIPASSLFLDHRSKAIVVHPEGLWFGGRCRFPQLSYGSGRRCLLLLLTLEMARLFFGCGK